MVLYFYCAEDCMPEPVLVFIYVVHFKAQYLFIDLCCVSHLHTRYFVSNSLLCCHFIVARGISIF